MTMKLLKDIATIRTGYPFRERAERVENDGVAIVQMRDIDGATGWVKANLERVATPPNWEAHRLHVGDVLLAGRGERNHAAQYAGDPNASNDDDSAVDVLAVAASHLVVLRLKPTGQVIPPYLAWYLNLPQTQERLRASRAGSNIPFIPIDALERIQIHVPSIEMQNHLVNLHQLSVDEQRLMTQIQEKRRELMAGVMQCLLTNQTTA
jgi:hypothetical protein